MTKLQPVVAIPLWIALILWIGQFAWMVTGALLIEAWRLLVGKAA